MKPMEIEKRSFEIIQEELGDRKLEPEYDLLIRRVIHTTADFEYVDTLAFSEHAMQKLMDAIRNGCDIVTDTTMAMSGINKKTLAKFGGTAHCFIADADVAEEAKARGVTRSLVSMEKAARMGKPLIFAVGNAPTALFSICELIREGKLNPEMVIGVPVGFVNVVEAKEELMNTAKHYIVNRGRKGGSNVAAAIVNAALYQLSAREEKIMVHFVGAGCGAPDLITVRGAKLLSEADVIIYAGSLVNPALLEYAKEGCEIHDSAKMTLEQVIEVMQSADAQGKTTVRLHTGDSSIYGAVREQFDKLIELGIAYDVCPGVSSMSGAAAALKAEYTLPEVSQTVIVTRMEGRTPVPEKEKLRLLASHGATMVLFLSVGLLDGVQRELMAGGYAPETPAAIVYKASWPDEKIFHCRLCDLKETAEKNNVKKTALILVGHFLGDEYARSKLYDPTFTTEFREAEK